MAKKNKLGLIAAFILACAQPSHASALFTVDTADILLTVTGVGGAIILVYLSVVGFHMAWSFVKRLKGK